MAEGSQPDATFWQAARSSGACRNVQDVVQVLCQMPWFEQAAAEACQCIQVASDGSLVRTGAAGPHPSAVPDEHLPFLIASLQAILNSTSGSNANGQGTPAAIIACLLQQQLLPSVLCSRAAHTTSTWQHHWARQLIPGLFTKQHSHSHQLWDIQQLVSTALGQLTADGSSQADTAPLGTLCTCLLLCTLLAATQPPAQQATGQKPRQKGSGSVKGPSGRQAVQTVATGPPVLSADQIEVIGQAVLQASHAWGEMLVDEATAGLLPALMSAASTHLPATRYQDMCRQLALSLLSPISSLLAVDAQQSGAATAAAAAGQGSRVVLGQVLKRVVALQQQILVGCLSSAVVGTAAHPAPLLQQAVLGGLQHPAGHTRARALHMLQAAIEVQASGNEAGAAVIHVAGYGRDQWMAFTSIFRCQEEHMQHLIQPTWQSSFPCLQHACLAVSDQPRQLSELLSWTSVLLTRSCSHSNVGVRQMGLAAQFNTSPALLALLAKDASSWCVFQSLLFSQLSVLENEKLLPGSELLLHQPPTTRQAQKVHTLCDALTVCVSNCMDALPASDSPDVNRTAFMTQLLNQCVNTVSKRAVTAIFLLTAIARAVESRQYKLYSGEALQGLFVPLLATVAHLRPAWRCRQVVGCLLRILAASTPAEAVTCQQLLQVLAAADARDPRAAALATLNAVVSCTTSPRDNTLDIPSAQQDNAVHKQPQQLAVQQAVHEAVQAVRIAGPSVKAWINQVLFPPATSDQPSPISQWIHSNVAAHQQPDTTSDSQQLLQQVAVLSALLPYLITASSLSSLCVPSLAPGFQLPTQASPVQVACWACLVVGIAQAAVQHSVAQPEVHSKVVEAVKHMLMQLTGWWWQQRQYEAEAGQLQGCAVLSAWPVHTVMSAHTWLVAAQAAVTSLGAPLSMDIVPGWEAGKLVQAAHCLADLSSESQVWVFGSLRLSLPLATSASQPRTSTLDITRLLQTLVQLKPAAVQPADLVDEWHRLRLEVVAGLAAQGSGAPGQQVPNELAEQAFSWCLSELGFIDPQQDAHALQLLLDVLLLTAPWAHLQSQHTVTDGSQVEASVSLLSQLLELLPGLIRGAGGAPLPAEVASRVVTLFFHPSLFLHPSLRSMLDQKHIPLVLSKGGPRLAVALLSHLTHHVLLPSSQLLHSYLPHLTHLIAFSVFSHQPPSSAAATAALRLDPALTLTPKVVLCGHCAAMARCKQDVTFIHDLVLRLLLIASGTPPSASPSAAHSHSATCDSTPDYSWMASRESGTESVVNGVRVSCWQTLSLLAPHLQGAVAQQALEVCWRCLLNPYQHANVRSHIQLVVLTLLLTSTTTQWDGVVGLLLPALINFSEKKYQVVVSVVIVALFYVLHVGPNNPHFKAIMHALLPWALHHRHAVRVPVQVLLHAILDKHGPSVWAGDAGKVGAAQGNVDIMSQMFAFLSGNPEMCVLRERQGLVDLAGFNLEHETSLAGVFGVRQSDESEADGNSEVTGLTWHVHVRDRLPMDLLSVLPGALKALGHAARHQGDGAGDQGDDDGGDEGEGGEEVQGEAAAGPDPASQTHTSSTGLAAGFQQLRPQLAAQAVMGTSLGAYTDPGVTSVTGVTLLSDEADLLGAITGTRRQARPAGLIVCASLLDNVPNMAGLCRTCESMGIEALVLPSKAIAASDAFKKQSVTSERWLRLLEVTPNDLPAFLREKKALQYTIIGLEQATGSIPLQSYSWPQAAVLLLGNEQNGVPAPLMPLLDVCLEIPMLGVTRSLNAHVSGAMSVWQYTQQWALHNNQHC